MKKSFEKVISRFKEDEEGICELEELYQKENRKIEIQKENKLSKTEKKEYMALEQYCERSQRRLLLF